MRWTAHGLLGSCLLMIGRVAEGITELEAACDSLRAAAEHDPDAEAAYVQLLFELGGAHAMLGEDAAPFFAEAAAISQARTAGPVDLTFAPMFGAFATVPLPEQIVRAEESVTGLRTRFGRPASPSPGSGTLTSEPSFTWRAYGSPRGCLPSRSTWRPRPRRSPGLQDSRRTRLRPHRS